MNTLKIKRITIEDQMINNQNFKKSLKRKIKLYKTA